MLDLLFESRNSEVDQIHFPAELGPSFVYANEEEVHHAVKEFLGEAGYESHKFPEEKKAKKKSKKEKKGKKGKRNKKNAKGKQMAKKKKPVAKAEPPGGDELVPATEAGEAEGKIVARRVGGGFPVFYPTRLPSGEAAFVESNPYEHIVDPRVYHLKDKDKERHAGLPDGRRLPARIRSQLLRHSGDPRLGRPTDPRRSDRNEEDRRS